MKKLKYLFYTLIDADYNSNTATSHSSRQSSVMNTNIHTYAYHSLAKQGLWVVHVTLCSDKIFHHSLGVIAIEVKNNRDIQNNKIYNAEEQLKTSHDFIQEFAKFNMPEDTSLPHMKVIAVPSTKKLTFDRKAFENLQDDTLLLFEEDLENLVV